MILGRDFRGEFFYYRGGVDLFDVVKGVLGEGQFVPGHEETPLHVHTHAILHVGNWAVLGHLDHLFCAYYCSQFGVDVFSASVVVGAGVTVIAKDVDELVTGVPLNFWGAPGPDEIVDLVMLCESDVQELV